MNIQIDLNADLGEGSSFDRELLTLVSSANISCGAHAGTVADIRAAIDEALALGVRIGAHPSYPDREHWGRRSLLLSEDALRSTLLSQLQWLASQVEAAGGRLQHVKPHGALYNDAARDPAPATLIASCVKEFDPALSLCGLAGGAMMEAGRKAGLTILAEAFVDRRYQADASLLPRSQPQALIKDVDQAIQQALSIIQQQTVTAIDGTAVTVKADTLCIHGDSAQALLFARGLRASLRKAGIVVAPQ